MLMSLTYIMLWLLCQSFVKTNCQTTLFNPKPRYSHAAALIDDKLYIFGGHDIYSGDGDVGTDLFYLDFSVPFNTQELLWTNISKANNIPTHGITASMKGGENNTLFLYVGRNSPNSVLVYTYNPQSNSWNIPEITGVSPKKKRTLTSVIDNGKMYLWGGYSIDDRKYVDDMLILDTINLVWEIGSSDGAPTPRIQYSAVLLPNNNIIYFGGLDDTGKITLNKVFIYNTINNNWIDKETSGKKIPQNRFGFSTVLGLDGQRIIIFGGNPITALSEITSPDESLYVLKLSNFEWYIPKITGNTEPRYNHRANVIGNYMVVSFGEGYKILNGPSDILLLDISNNDEYVWTKDYKPTIDNKDNKLTIIIIIGTLISLIGSVLLLISSFYLYKESKKYKVKKELQSIPHMYSYN